MKKKLLGALFAVIVAACAAFSLAGTAFAGSYSTLYFGYNAGGMFTYFDSNAGDWEGNNYAYPDDTEVKYAAEKPSTPWYYTKDGEKIVLVLVSGEYEDGVIYSDEMDFDIVVEGDVTFKSDYSIYGLQLCNGNVTITGKGSLTIGSYNDRYSSGIYAPDTNLVIKNTTLTIYDTFDGIAMLKDEAEANLEIINSKVMIDDLGVEDSHDFGGAEDGCSQPACAIHACGNVTIDSSEVVAKSLNQYGIYTAGKLILKANTGLLKVTAITKDEASLNSNALRCDDLQGIDFSALEGVTVELFAGATSDTLTQVAFADLDPESNYVIVSAKKSEPVEEPDPIPETGDATPFVALLGVIALAGVGAVVARKRLA